MFEIKVVAGQIRGLKLNSDKNENLRPTKDRIKESLFDIIGYNIFEKRFLDLFGGTGQIGIEAFSRGAKEVVIIEIKKSHADLINKNISKIKCDHNIKFFQLDAVDFLKNNKKNFDIIFIDPPYQDVTILQSSLDFCIKNINKDGIMITETLSSQNIQNKIGDFSLQKRYNYGNISLNLYKSEF